MYEDAGDTLLSGCVRTTCKEAEGLEDDRMVQGVTSCQGLCSACETAS